VGADLEPAIETFARRLRHSATSDTSPVASARALVVDDSATVRELHGMLLVRAGFEVELVAEGELALVRARNEVFGVVVSGLQLRGLSGFDLCAALRALPGYADVRILLVSADADVQRTRKAVDAGATALLRKGSFENEQLSSVFSNQ
jgi:CheY-like chemotaxis protein